MRLKLGLRQLPGSPGNGYAFQAAGDVTGPLSFSPKWEAVAFSLASALLVNYHNATMWKEYEGDGLAAV